MGPVVDGRARTGPRYWLIIHIITFLLNYRILGSIVYVFKIQAYMYMYMYMECHCLVISLHKVLNTVTGVENWLRYSLFKQGAVE